MRGLLVGLGIEVKELNVDRGFECESVFFLT